MAFDKDAFLTSLDSMSVMDLNDLVKAIEEKFGVSAASMAANNCSLVGLSINVTPASLIISSAPFCAFKETMVTSNWPVA